MSLESGGSVSPDGETAVDLSSSAKRRKVRKGTRSCWECKRRKIRCTFTTTGDSVCIGCRRRGATCVSQEFAEQTSPVTDRGRGMGDRIVRVEVLIEKLARRVGANDNEPGSGQEETRKDCCGVDELDSALNENEGTGLRAVEEDVEANRNAVGCTGKLQPAQHTPVNGTKYVHVAEALHAAFPSDKDLGIIYESGGDKTVVFSLMMSTPYPVIERQALVNPRTLFTRPAKNTHPVLLARHMLMLATALQYIHPSVLNLDGLSERPHDMLRRLIGTAVRLVTTNEELLGSFESLHCILLEGFLQANCGNLRRASLAFKRAVSVAQLMGIHRGWPHLPLKVLDPKAGVYPQYMWFRVIMADRVLCLMLGLPQASTDLSMASPDLLATDTPVGRLERIHTALSSRVLKINETDPGLHDYSRIEDIDMELQKAAEEMTGKWWLSPNITDAAGDQTELFQKMIQLMRQVAHFNLLNQLHFPYMLRPSTTTPPSDRAKYDYSRSTCVTASRELLSRFVLFRAQEHVAFCCRSVEFSALMAAMTLLLAHIDGGRKQDSLLAHQRLSDRAKVEEMLENRDCVHEIHADALSGRSAGLLRSLLAIEADAAGGRQTFTVESIHRSDPSMLEKSQGNVLRLSIPYFGIVKISAECGVAGATWAATTSTSRVFQNGQSGDPSPLGAGALPSLSLCPARTKAPAVSFPQQQDLGMISEHHAPNLAQSPTAISGELESDYRHLEGVSSPENWESQGLCVDIFDHLMRGRTDVLGDAPCMLEQSWDGYSWRPEL
ncbi:hypothetical protein QBC44DRAFT_315011 [Cladorrhinum sp. PSN332]|nr:hypothetical protein QBC44DRAFT_315011 [Cladorrhinum sp. PSN332]